MPLGRMDGTGVTTMHITGMTVGPGSHPAFGENFDLRFDERVNVFIGSNACGKTSLLRIIASEFGGDQTAEYRFTPENLMLSDDWLFNPSNPNQVALKDALLGHGADPFMFEKPWYWTVPYIHVPATRIVLPSDLDAEDIQLSDDERASLESEINWREHTYIFDSKWIAKIYKYLYDDHQHRGDALLDSIARASKIANECAAYIAEEILTGNPSTYVQDKDNALESDFGRFRPLMDDPYVHPAMGTRIKTNEYGATVEEYLGNLSAGTQSTLMWVLYLSLKMMCHYQGIETNAFTFRWRLLNGDWHEQPAILLIDEIENHLHPAWQRRVIPAIRKHFPNVQIFATTHSPFMVAGRKAGQVHLLDRANGVVTATPNSEHIVGWTADEILRTMMGVEDPTDDATAAAARELRQLRNEGPRDTEDSEAARQARMQELRRLVNRDLLAGGPAAAQRELFEQQFAEALEKYQRSRDLGQDSG